MNSIIIPGIIMHNIVAILHCVRLVVGVQEVTKAPVYAVSIRTVNFIRLLPTAGIAEG